MNMIISPLRKVMTVAILATALAGSSIGALANRTGGTPAGGPHPAGNPTGGSPKGSASNAEVRYVDNKAGNYLFNVVYDNATGSRFSLRVLDPDGNQLFQSFYSDKKFDKMFKIIDAEGKFTFIIKNYQDNSTQSFEINSTTRLVEDIEVKEVK